MFFIKLHTAQSTITQIQTVGSGRFRVFGGINTRITVLGFNEIKDKYIASLAEVTGHDAKLILAERMSETKILVTFIIVDTATTDALKTKLGESSFATDLTNKLKSKGVTTFSVTGTTAPVETNIPGKSHVFQLG
jgi:hypothetical protein